MCEVCSSDDFWFCENVQQWYMRVQNSNWNETIDSFDYTDIPVNYCCECGKKL